MFDAARIRQHLRDFALTRLFVQELGWDHHTTRLEVSFDSKAFELNAIAQKRGMVAFNCSPSLDGSFPDYQIRRKIERQVAKTVHEHLIIYTDRDNTTQIWQWVKREAGKPVACREHTYHRNQAGDALVQKLQNLVFTLDEEDRITILEPVRHARAAFDVERVTKRFYDRFKSEHAAFLKFIKGIPDEEHHRWYASVMLNRLMFIYFIQKKDFLDNDPNYLRNKLKQSQQHGNNRFYTDFLCRLFFDGFAKTESGRSQATQKLLGKVPYLNGGIFLRYQIEELHGKQIHIADVAFEKLFDFFEQYQWHLDERPLRQDNEINPDVLGYIFEKYINQKQMGAYYTKEDITGYISQNTVIPFLFDAARQKCKIAFEGDHSIWRSLQVDPDRYIYEPVRRGVIDEKGNIIPESVLPDFVQKGMKDPKARMFDRRYNLGEAELRDSEGKKLTSPTETWREYVQRRQRCLELRQKLALGEIHEINDLITYNLDIRQCAQDVIENSEGPELLRAFWHAIEKVTVLDPTVGSGAFLFAALNILEPLYEACLDRMEVFLAELESSREKHRPEKFGDFRKILERTAQHPNRRYFVLKSIIVSNLFGVDIMEEAIEICKLRLFLKLVAQVERVDEIEPLPDIDFNIRTGNTLVGFTTLEDVKQAISTETSGQTKIQFDDTLQRIEEKAQDIEHLFQLFRQQQTELGGEVTPADKQELRKRLNTLEDQLNRYLAREYGVDPKKKDAYETWLGSHKPFHWFIEFYGIMKKGGFDVIIGNPPYVEMNKVRDYRVFGYSTLSCGNLYPLCVERSSSLLCSSGSFAMIIPLSGFSTDRMVDYQDHLWNRYGGLYISYYSGDAHPSVLFNGVKYRLCIVVGRPYHIDASRAQTTEYVRWYANERPYLFSKLSYAPCQLNGGFLRFAKLGNLRAAQILEKMLSTSRRLNAYLATPGTKGINYHRSPVFWIRSMDFEPYFKSPTKERSTDHLRDLYGRDQSQAIRVGAILNSTCFYFWFTVQGNCRNVAGPDIENFPIGDLSTRNLSSLELIFSKLMEDLKRNSRRRVYHYERSGRVEYDEFYPDKSKSVIDKIDSVLARHYGFTDEELDFIMNYDLKYRMGREEEGEFRQKETGID